jgi:transposase
MATAIELRRPVRTALEQTFRETTDRRLRDRCQAVLLAANGLAQPAIATALLVSERSVRRWLAAFRARGLAGLRITWPRGATPKIDPAHREIVREWVRRGPAAVGVDAAGWTAATLAAQYRKVYGVRVSVRTMRRFCQRHDIRPYRPSYRYLRGHPVKRARARRALRALKRGPGEASSPF